MTHTYAYRLSRLTVPQDHTRPQLYPNTTSFHHHHPPPPPHPKISATWLFHQWPVISYHHHPFPLPPPPPPQPLPSDDSRLERLDPKDLSYLISSSLSSFTCYFPKQLLHEVMYRYTEHSRWWKVYSKLEPRFRCGGGDSLCPPCRTDRTPAEDGTKRWPFVAKKKKKKSLMAWSPNMTGACSFNFYARLP